jgi:multidrug efflux system outer membrane protein
MRSLLFITLIGTATAQVGPNYQRPATETAPQFKGVTWRAATPSAHLPKGMVEGLS